MIEETTLYDTVRKVQGVPPKERRIIVYTGVHPHEGTAELARPHEDRWKRYGVLVVAQPSDSTPHAIWQRHRELCTDGVFRPLDYSVKIDETAIENTIAGGEPTLFLRFHGTSIIPNLKENGYRDPVNQVANWALQLRIDMAYGGLHGHTHEEAWTKYQEEVKLISGIGPYPKDRINLEYMYEGQEFVTNDPFVALLLAKHSERYDNGVSKTFHEDDKDAHSRFDKKGNISPSYLVQHTLTEADKKAFHNEHVKELDDLIRVFSEFYG